MADKKGLRDRSAKAQNVVENNRVPYNRNSSGNNSSNAPTFSGRFYTGLLLAGVLLWSIYSLLQPFAPRNQYLNIFAPAGTKQDAIVKAMTDTGSLPNPSAVKLAFEGNTWKAISSDIKNPVAADTWKALARLLPAKLAGTKAEFKADAPDAIKRGLDLQGGLRVVLEAETVPSKEDLNVIRNIIESRVNATGVSEPLVQVQGDRRVVVEEPGLSQADQARALALLGQTAKLEFRMVKSEASQKKTADMTIADLGDEIMSGSDIRNATSGFSQLGAPQVNLELTPQGAIKFDNVTAANIGKQMAIVLDGKVKSAPNINQRISGGSAQITGSFTLEETNDLALVLRSGSFPVPVKIIETRAIGPTLGQDAIRQGFTASLIGVSAVVALLFLYYGFWFGLVAALGLLFSGLIIFGIFAGLGGVLTLPGIAGLVLTIGAAVDGNVISFERVKEELRNQKGLKQAIRAGFGHSLATILDVNFSHLLSALALYSYSTGPVKGFAVMLAVGVIASAFSNLVFSPWALEMLAQRIKFSAPQWFKTPNFDFMGLSRIITTASIILAFIGLGIILSKGFVYGVDFTSGTAFTVRANADVKSDTIRNLMDKVGVKGVTSTGASIVETSTPGISGKDFTVRVGELGQDDQAKMVTAFKTLPGGQVIQTEAVGPTVGNELRSNTIKAVLWALLFTLIYVAVRFDFILGIGSVLAVAHDVFIVMGLFALLGREFSITTVAAILTLIGYSLNDSIIVSDRIRENLKVMRGKPYVDIVNASINQTLSRTLMTSVATMLPLLALLVLGGPVLRDFSLVLLVGILVGTYSSIYIVSPMAVFFKEWQAKNQPIQGRKAKI